MVGITTNVGERAYALREKSVKINEIAARVGRGKPTVILILAASKCPGDNQVPPPKPCLGGKKRN